MSEMRITDEFEEYGALASVSRLSLHPSRQAHDTRLERAVDHLPDTVCLIDADGEINHVSAPVRSLLSRDPWSFAGANALKFVHPFDRPRAKAWFTRLGETNEATDDLVVQLSAADRSWVTVEISGRRIGRQAPYEVVCTVRALDGDRTASSTMPSLRRRASDGMVTRDRFARTVRAIGADAPGHPLVIFVDVDDFANLRLAYGESVAEDVVQRVRGVLSSLVRLDDVIGHLEEGSLAVLFRDVPDGQIHNLVRRISRGLRHPVQTGSGRVRVSASIGSARPNARPLVLPAGA